MPLVALDPWMDPRRPGYPVRFELLNKKAGDEGNEYAEHQFG